MSSTLLKTSLDENAELPVKMEHVEHKGQRFLRLRVDFSFTDDHGYYHEIRNPKLRDNLRNAIRLHTGERLIGYRNEGDGITLELPEEECHDTLTLEVNGRTVNRFLRTDGEWKADPANADYQLTVTETRLLGHDMTDYIRAHVPYPRDYAGKLNKHHMPRTDLHTHLSSQLSGRELLDLAIGKDMYYPTQLIDVMNQMLPEDEQIDVSGLSQQPDVPVYKFSPAVNTGVAQPCEMKDMRENSGVSGFSLKEFREKQPKDFARFVRFLSVPVDETIGPNDMDKTLYRFRNPLEKSPVLTREKILQVAKNYKAQGVEYAELSTGSMFNPDWFEEAVAAIREAQEDPAIGVKIRLLVGIPRTAPPDSVAMDLEKIKFLARHPVIAGIDFLGYEGNSTSDFSWAIYNMARWAQRLKDGSPEQSGENQFSHREEDFVIRVHAGENNENQGNVAEVIEIGKNFNIPIRIGHCLHTALTDQLVEQVKKTGIMLEFIQDSWIGLRNAQFPHHTSMNRWIEQEVPFVFGSDGAGAYHTSPHQSVKTGLAAGVSLDSLAAMRGTEQQYIRQRDTLFNDKARQFDRHYGEGKPGRDQFFGEYRQLLQKLDSARKLDKLPEQFADKKPILLAGASGSSWGKIEPEHKKELITAAEMMVEMLDPAKVFFASGRVKDRGFERCIDRAIIERDHHGRYVEPTFDMLATAAFGEGPVKVADGATWVQAVKSKRQRPDGSLEEIAGKSEDVPTKVLPQIKRRDGLVIFAGGNVLTDSFINAAREQGVKYGLVQGPHGTAHEYSLMTGKDRVIAAGGEQTLACAMMEFVAGNLGKEVFRPGYWQALDDPQQRAELFKTIYDAKRLDLQRRKPDPVFRSSRSETRHEGTVSGGERSAEL